MPYVTLDQVKPPPGFTPSGPSPKNAGGVTLDQVKPPPGWSASAPAASTKPEPAQAQPKSAGSDWFSYAKKGAQAVGAAIGGALPGVGVAANLPQDVSFGRGLVAGALGWPGSLERFATQTVPSFFGQQPSSAGPWGAGTVLPPVSTVEHGLTKLGVPVVPGQQSAQTAGEFVGGFAQPGAILDATVGRGVRAAGRGLQQFAEQGGKASRGVEALGHDIGAQARAGVGKTLQDAPSIPARSIVPAPTRSTLLRDLPGTSNGLPESPMSVSKDFETAASDIENAIRGQKQKTAEDFWSRMGDTKVKPDLKPLLTKLRQEIDAAPGGPLTGERQRLISQLTEYADSPNATLKGYDELRRALSEKAAYGAEDRTGFGTLKQLGFGDTYAKMLNKSLDNAVSDYGKYRATYSKLAQSQEPFASRFLKDIGSTEASSENLVGKALSSPKNVDRAVEALGGNSKQFDGMAARYVTNELAGKSSVQLEKYIAENAPVLRKLPQTRRVVETVLQRSELADALQGIQKTAEQHLQGVAKSSAEAQQLANSYRVPLSALQGAPTRKIPGLLNGLVDKMLNDGLINEAKHQQLLSQIENAQRGLDKEKKVRTVAKFVAYALTHNYLLSFGGPAIVDYMTHK